VSEDIRSLIAKLLPMDDTDQNSLYSDIAALAAWLCAEGQTKTGIKLILELERSLKENGIDSSGFADYFKNQCNNRKTMLDLAEATHAHYEIMELIKDFAVVDRQK
jgi:hypothetical protein